MDQSKKIVLEAPKGMHYVTMQKENGELIIWVEADEQSRKNEKSSKHRILEESLPCAFNKRKKAQRKRELPQNIGSKDQYFVKVYSHEIEELKEWLKIQKCKGKKAKTFIKRVRAYCKMVKGDYLIATLEPCVINDNIYYIEGENVGVGYTTKQWENMAKNYWPERQSRLSTTGELLIWYAIRIMKGLWTIEEAVKDSTNIGNYLEAENASKTLDRVGAKMCGGYYDGQGNTCKIVLDYKQFSTIGGRYCDYGDEYPITEIDEECNPQICQNYGTGIVVIPGEF